MYVHSCIRTLVIVVALESSSATEDFAVVIDAKGEVSQFDRQHSKLLRRERYEQEFDRQHASLQRGSTISATHHLAVNSEPNASSAWRYNSKSYVVQHANVSQDNIVSNPLLKESLARLLRTCHGLNLSVTLFGGTALGFRRNGEQNLVDYDVDVAVSDKDLRKLGSTLKEQQTAVLREAKANKMVPKQIISAPFFEQVGKEAFSMVYQFAHTDSHPPADMYVFHEDDDGHLWIFLPAKARSGEFNEIVKSSGTGLKFPSAVPSEFDLSVDVPGAVEDQKVYAAPVSWLTYLYGDWQVVHTNYKGYKKPIPEPAFDTDDSHNLPRRGFLPME